jgi:predicted nicotinamide N-methyase
VPSRPAAHRHGGRPEPAPSPSPANLRAFVRRHTRLVDVPDAPGVRLSLADDVTAMWHLAGRELGDTDPPLPYWAFAWAGGLALSRYLFDHPADVAGLRVLDVASGSGLCAITAMLLGAASAHAADVDALSEAAVAVNARANGVRVGFSLGDVTAADPPPCDLVLAGDIGYEEAMAGRMLDWLRLATRSGARVLVGDPGRRYLPPGLERLATYRVQTSRELEAGDRTDSSVYSIRG